MINLRRRLALLGLLLLLALLLSLGRPVPREHRPSPKASVDGLSLDETSGGQDRAQAWPPKFPPPKMPRPKPTGNPLDKLSGGILENKPGSPAPYVLRDRNLSAFFDPLGILFALHGRSSPGAGPGEESGQAIRWSLLGAKTSTPRPENPLPGRVHDYRGEASTWRPDASSYGTVVYDEVRPGVDLLIETRPKGLKYTLQASRATDLGTLRFQYEGSHGVRVTEDGAAVEISTGAGTLREDQLKVWQDGPEGRQAVQARYIQAGPAAYGIELENVDPELPITVDPVISWSTLMGGSVSPVGEDYGQAIAVAPDGSTYVAGYTYCVDFPGVAGGLSSTLSGTIDAFLVKINPLGTARDWATYLGGSSYDYAYGVATDGSGNVFVTGVTGSSNFPTTAGAYDTSALGYDTFVMKFLPSGSLSWSTLLGGSSSDYGQAIAVDASGNVYVGGYTYSSNFPIVGGFDPSAASTPDCYVAKLNPSGTTLLWSSYLGGNNTDQLTGIAVNAGGSVYVTGYTYSTDFPTVNAYYPTNKGNYDAFLTKINASGASIDWSTYLGGVNADYSYGITLANDVADPDPVIAGYTTSSDFPTTLLAYDTIYNLYEVFVTRFKADGSALVYSTFLGGTGYDYGTAIAAGAAGTVFVTGYTGSSNFPTSTIPQPAPHRSTLVGGYDGFVTQLNAAGNGIIVSTYVGGTSYEYPRAIAVRAGTSVVITGYTNSTAVSTPAPGQIPFDGVLGGTTDAYAVQFPLNLSTVNWANFVGGANSIGDDWGQGVAVDSLGNVYVTGYTNASDYPTVIGILDWQIGGTQDAFLSKISTNTLTDVPTLVWSTFIGGSSSDWGYSVAVDASNRAYVAGTTASSDFTLLNAWDAVSSGYEAFLTRFNTDGTLSYSTFVGGSSTDYGRAVAVDSSSNAYVTGYTYSSTGFPLLAAFDGTFGGGSDTFVTKFNSAGVGVWSSYLGGTGYETGLGIAADNAGNVYLSGYTDSIDLTAVGPDTTNGGYYDAYVARVNANGTLGWVRYLGGIDYDYGNAIVIDGAGTALYAVGQTFSTDFPVPGGLDTVRNSYEGFATKLDPATGNILWSTFLGGTSTDYINGAAVNAAGDLYVTGQTASSNFPVKGAFDATLTGGYDAFVTKIYADGSALVWSTYLGGTNSDYGQGIAVDSTGIVYVTGYTYSTDFPVLNWLDNTMQGNQDAFLVRIKHANPDVPDFSPLGTGQFKTDGSTLLGVGAWTNQTSFIARAKLTDSDDEDVRLEVEIQPVGVVFGTGSLFISTVPVRPGQIASTSVTFPGASGSAYHWRARTVDSRGLVSAWMSFGGNLDAPLPAVRDIGFDTTNPVPLIDTPTTAGVYYTTSSTVALGGTSSDLGAGVGSLSWFNNLPLPVGVGGGASGISPWTVGSVPLQPGANNISISATDLAGNSGPALITIHRDNTPPLISITTPASDPFATGSSSVFVSGTASDSTLLSSVTWSNNRGGSGTATVGGGTWNIDPAGLITGLSPGLNVITVTATDAAGNTAADTVTINYDTVPPAVTILTPAPGTVTQIPGMATTVTIGLTGNASDNVALAAVNPVTWQNLSYPAYFGNATGGASWSLTATLGVGANTIQITATDSIGLSSSTTITLYGDSSVPGVDITVPDNSATFNTGATTLALSGNATDDIGLQSITWVYSGGGSGSGTLNSPGTTASTWTIAPITLTTGAFDVTVTVTDLAGRTNTDVLTVNRDANAPSIVVSNPPTTVFVTKVSNLLITGTAADNANVTAFSVTNSPNLVPVSVTRTPAPPAPFIDWTATVSLNPGINTVTLTATDIIPNTTTVTLTIIYDPVSPLVKITGPTTADDYATGTGTLALAGTASDDRAVTEVTWVNAATSAFGTATGTNAWSVPPILLNAGTQLITVTAKDEAGNSTTDTLSVTFDATQPDVTITSPTVAATMNIASNNVALAGTASDNVMVGSITWSNAATGASGAAGGTTSWTVASVTLVAGANPLTVVATDSAGNLRTDTLIVYYDTQVPAAVITGPTSLPVFQTNTGTVAISGTASDDIGVASVSWSRSNGMSIAVGTAQGTTDWEETSVTLVAGDNLITVTVTDIVGKTTQATLTIHFDPTAPSISITTPTAAATTSTTNTPLLIGGSASDLTGTLALVDATQVSWMNTTTGGSGIATLTGSTWSALVPLTSGSNTVQAFAVDAAGNTASDQLIVIYDPAAPLVTIQGPTTDLTYTTGTTPVVLSGIATDDVGVAGVSWSSNAAILPASGPAVGTDIWSASIELVPGANLLTITATDAVGRTGTSRITVIYDPTPPSVAITTPSTEALVQSTTSTISLGGIASDNLLVQSVTWSNLSTGDSGSASGTGVWSVSSVNLVTGNNLISVTTTDGVGNSTTASITIVYDGEPPTVSITTPTAAATYATTVRPLLLSGPAGDNLQLAGVTWTNSLGGSGTAGTLGTPTAVTWSASVYLFAGTNVITVTASDAHGYTASDVLSIDYTPESFAPGIAITSPSSGGSATSATQRVTIGGNADDNVNVTGVTWINQSTLVRGTATLSAAPPSPQPWSAEVPLVNGSNVIVFTAIDDAGNTASATIVVEFSSPPDTLTPTVIITGPTLSDVWSSSVSPVVVTMTATDGTGVASVSWTNTGTGGTGVASLVSGDIWTTPVALALGANTIVFTARDAAGNTGNDTLIVSFLPPSGDSSAPSISITSHPTTSTAQSSTRVFSLAGSSSDNVAVTGVFWSNAANGSSASADGTLSWTADLFLEPGINILTMKVYDSSGNIDTDLLTVLYSPPPPPAEEQTAGACGLLGIEVLAVLAWRALRRRKPQA